MNKEDDGLPAQATNQMCMAAWLLGSTTRIDTSLPRPYPVSLFTSFIEQGVYLMRGVLICLLTLILCGCINITTELQPSNPDVQDVLMGEDCTPIVLGAGLGTNTIEGAKKDGRPLGDVGEFRSRIKLNDRTPINRIRTIQISSFYVLLVGSSCIQVIGEP
jgi:hypothetical protein